MIKSTDTPIFTVTSLNQLVGNLLEEALPSIWVEGEISNLVQPASGHLYFSLKDAKAHVRCAMFRFQNRSLPFEPKNGQQVLVYAKVGLYAPRGEFQLIIEVMELAGDGKLRLQFEQLKQKLVQEGLFEARFKKATPAHPQTIGVITSPTGAAIRDILNVLKRRAPHIHIIIYPTLVQGSEAASQIVKAIETANIRAECDVLILARGGGSLEDLWPFNEEIVARAIFEGKIPIITGIGHEIDFTISDWVADLRAPTPSAAAELVSTDVQTWQKQLDLFEEKLLENIKRSLQRLRDQLSYLAKRLKHPKKQLQEWSQKVDVLGLTLARLIRQTLHQKQQVLRELTHVLDSISPLATLKRGYAIARDKDKNIVKEATQVLSGGSLEVLLGKGCLNCKVVEVSDSHSNILQGTDPVLPHHS